MGQKTIGMVFFLLGLAICLLDPVITLKCTKAEGSEATCDLSVRSFGIVPVAATELQGVTKVAISSYTWHETGMSERGEDVEQLILHSKSGEVRSKWLCRREGFTPNRLIISLPPFQPFLKDMDNLFEFGKIGDLAVYKAFNWVPLWVGLGFMLFGVLALWPFLLPAKRSGPGMIDR